MIVETFSLYELNEHIRRVIALNFEQPLWVRCEISQVGSSRGHYYLNLVEKDEDSDNIRAQSSAALWARSYHSLFKKYGPVVDELLQDGMEVRVKVSVDFHERYGLKLIIEDVDPGYTMGNLEIRRREILEKLKSKGLLELNAGVKVPAVLQRIAILSAEHAAGYQDFKEHLFENDYGYVFDVDLYNVALQGNKVEQEVVDALREIKKAVHHYDCVVVIRGGGSRLDLSAFDSYAIAESIASFPIPVFTGIGHEIDNTVADVVANRSLKTPTAVADMIVSYSLQFETGINEMFDQLVYSIDVQVTNARRNLENSESLLTLIPAAIISRHRQWLDNLQPRLLQLRDFTFSKLRKELVHASSILDALEPHRILARGFSVTRHNGNIIQDPRSVKSGDTIDTEFSTGHISSIVK